MRTRLSCLILVVQLAVGCGGQPGQPAEPAPGLKAPAVAPLDDGHAGGTVAEAAPDARVAAGVGAGDASGAGAAAWGSDARRHLEAESGLSGLARHEGAPKDAPSQVHGAPTQASATPPRAATPDGYPAVAPHAAPTGTILLEPDLDPYAAGLYKRLCALCHGERGEGYAADNAPSLVTTTFRESADEEFLRRAIANGRPGTAMGAYGAEVGGPLAPADVNVLVAYLRAGSPPVPPDHEARPAGDPLRGGVLYEATCQACHGTPEQRATAVHLFNPMLVATASDAFLRHGILAGRPGTPMPAWDGVLDDVQVDDLVAFIRSRALPLAPPPVVQQPAAPRTGPVVLNPKGKPAKLKLKDGRLVSLEALKAALDQKRRIVICDARAPSEWLSLHIEGAISTPYYDKPSLDDIPKDGTWVVAYCACPHHASGEVVDELRRRGYKNTAVLDEGVFAWQHKGYPVVTAPGGLATAAPPGMANPVAPQAPAAAVDGAVVPADAARRHAPSVAPAPH